jgi:hypothetical protein
MYKNFLSLGLCDWFGSKKKKKKKQRKCERWK